jgi:hypothetical protein
MYSTVVTSEKEMFSRIASKLLGNPLVRKGEEYLQAREYQTDTHELREGCYVVQARREQMGVTDTHLLMLITSEETKTTKKHVEHPLKLGRKHGADNLSIVSEAPATAASRKAASKAPIDVLSQADLERQPPQNELMDDALSSSGSKSAQKAGSDRRQSAIQRLTKQVRDNGKLRKKGLCTVFSPGLLATC